MSQPPENDAHKRTIGEIAEALRELHRALLDVVRVDYESHGGVVRGPNDMLMLAMHDPSFGWLRALSGLMVDIDELIDSGEVSEADATAVRHEIEALIARPAEDTSEFARKYVDALQAEPMLILSHGKVRRLAGSLPEPHPDRAGEMRAVRGEWPERRRARRGK